MNQSIRQAATELMGPEPRLIRLSIQTWLWRHMARIWVTRVYISRRHAMIRSTLLASLTAILLGGAAMTTAIAQTDAYPRSPPPQSANNQATPDMDCRQQAAAEVGYPTSTGGNNQAAPSDAQKRYAAAYYDCMSGGSSGPPPSNAYAYGPPPNAYGYGPPPAYGPPPPYYYGPGSYAYPYYPPYFGPAVSFGFGFGGRGR